MFIPKRKLCSRLRRLAEVAEREFGRAALLPPTPRVTSDVEIEDPLPPSVGPVREMTMEESIDAIIGRNAPAEAREMVREMLSAS